MFFDLPIQYDEPLYRPPGEAESLILQVTVGCSYNRCSFCAMYRSKKFRLRGLPEIFSEIARAAEYCSRHGIAPRKVFLGDGDALAAPVALLAETADALQRAFPRLKRISLYASVANVLAKRAEELRMLSAKKVSLAYLGLESGSEKVLRAAGKGNSAQAAIDAAGRLDDAGWQTSVMVMLGLGGREYSAEHARETSRVLSIISPHFLSFLTTMMVPGTPLYQAAAEGRIEPLTVREILVETAEMLDRIEPQKRRTIFRANHASNLLPLEGILPRDRAELKARLAEWIEQCPADLYPERDGFLL